MEILHFKDLGGAANVVTNAVILVPNIPLGDIYPHMKLYRNVLVIDNVMPL